MGRGVFILPVICRTLANGFQKALKAVARARKCTAFYLPVICRTLAADAMAGVCGAFPAMVADGRRIRRRGRTGAAFLFAVHLPESAHGRRIDWRTACRNPARTLPAARSMVAAFASGVTACRNPAARHTVATGERLPASDGGGRLAGIGAAFASGGARDTCPLICLILAS